ncbi:MAG: hypothetical protein NVSMB46_02770 [Candidatus Saccharimonadales bacterium]
MKVFNNSQTGFTIVELLIALVIIATVFGAFTESFVLIQTLNKKTMDINYANNIAYAKAESYENTNYSNLPSTSPSGTLVQVEDFSSSISNQLEAPRVGKVYINSISNNLKQVVVTLTFGSGPSQRLIQYGNFIQKNGLGR